ncbi:MAG TPA: aquaporin [Thermoplasmata archaeon]|nr:aquaporin [Thermoplasmata archaeon]
MTWSAGQRYLGEFLGTFGLLFSVTAGAVFTVGFAAIDPVARVVLISLAIGFGLVGMIYVFGDLSGGHFNPAVTVGLWVAGRFKARDVIPYIVAQLAGAIVAVATVAGVAYGASGVWSGATGSTVALASQGYSGNGSPYAFAVGSVFLIEVAITFLLVLVILFTTRSQNFSKNLAPLGIGLTLLMINLVAIPVDGASANPARSFAPAILSAYFSGDQWAIQQDWIFWVAPLIGAAIAGAVDWILRTPSGTD